MQPNSKWSWPWRTQQTQENPLSLRMRSNRRNFWQLSQQDSTLPPSLLPAVFRAWDSGSLGSKTSALYVHPLRGWDWRARPEVACYPNPALACFADLIILSPLRIESVNISIICCDASWLLCITATKTHAGYLVFGPFFLAASWILFISILFSTSSSTAPIINTLLHVRWVSCIDDLLCS